MIYLQNSTKIYSLKPDAFFTLNELSDTSPLHINQLITTFVTIPQLRFN